MQKHIKERLYSGREELILITVTFVNPIPPTGAGLVELIVNGAAISDGVLDKKNSITSRTWLLSGVKTIDLFARDKNYSSGEYALSVLY